jgi:predicted ATPase/class 3 adenylate cyclase/Flp pilus assembly protein TadD
MDQHAALLLTDLVDSATLADTLGDEAMAAVWAAHDRAARDLLRQWHGREIDKTDGFLLLFEQAADALGYAMAYHRALATLNPPLRARAGLHVGRVTLRETPAEDVALGAKPLEVDGVSKPVAARVMSTALGGQTLLTQAALNALGSVAQRVVSHGHWRVKGLPEPLELFEVGEPGAPFAPPPDSSKVYRVLRQGELWLPARELRHSLPAERDAFVGRGNSLRELARRFDSGARLVSVLGIGGAGKTRLATRFGWVWLGEFPGGVWFCDLAAARTVEGLCGAVAQGLQLPLGQDDPVQQIGHALAGRGECLLILDNFEQLARHAEATLGRWLERAGQARFLVTTREVLGIAGEETLALAPLQAGDAEALFLRRAAAAKRDFQPGPEDQAAIAPLVKLLDGLPLAIELAAARVRTLSPRALLARMSERFKLLASSGGRLDRQATRRAAFDWSWELLPSAEKAALAQLAVFEGGFTLEAAEAVIDLSHLSDPPWTLDVVNALVDKSFVRALGGERFDLLGSVQAYAAEHLATPGRWAGSGPEAVAAAQARHGAWFAALGAQRAVEGDCAELDNLVAACRRAVAAANAAIAAGALEGAWAALSLRGPFRAGVQLAEAVCGLAALRDHEAGRAYAALAEAQEALGQRQAALKHYELALAHAKAAQDLACEAAATTRRARLQSRAGDAEGARRGHGLALELARRLGDRSLEGAALNGLGVVEFEHGRLVQAQAHYEAALALARQADDRRLLAGLLGNLGSLHASAGRIDEARTSLEASLQEVRRLGDRQREGNTLSNLGMLRYLQGDMHAARAVLEEALAVARELGHARLECAVLGNLGSVFDRLQQPAEALQRYQAALTVARQTGHQHTQVHCLGHMGLAEARQGNFAAATEHLEAAQQVLAGDADPLALALLDCQRAECAWLAGDEAQARKSRAAAGALAAEEQISPQSELGQALSHLDQLFGR